MNFFIQYKQGILVILLVCLSVPFMIMPRAPTVTGSVEVLRCQIFSIYYYYYLKPLLGQRGCRIHQLHLCRGVRRLQRMSWYDTKQSDDEASILELWGIVISPKSTLTRSGNTWQGSIYELDSTVWHSNSLKTNGLYCIELLDHLTV